MNHLVAQPTAPVILMGDFNKSEDQLRRWLHDGGWSSPPHALSNYDPSFKTFWQSSRALTAAVDGTSWIDHILLHSSAQALVTPMRVELAIGSYWLTCTDHRPVVLTLQSTLFEPSQVRTSRPRAVTSFRRRDLDRRDKLAVSTFQDNLVRDIGQPPDVATLSMMEADKLLQDISEKSLLALPGTKLSNVKTHRYKDGWSPCLVALEAHCRAISRIAYRLRGFGKGKW